MIQQATATLSSTFTNKFVVKAIKPTLKLARVNITSAMTFALNRFDDRRSSVIGISNATTSDQTDVTLVVTSPDGLTSFNVTLVIFKTGSVLIETFNARPEWVGYTIAGDGIVIGTTIISYTPKSAVNSDVISLSQTGALLSVRQKTQIRIDTDALGIPWEESANYTFEVSEGFVIDTDTDTNFTSQAQTIAYTANPVLSIISSDPAIDAAATDTNDYVTFTLNRPILPYIGANFYFYKSVGGTDTLLKTFPINSGIISGKTITLDVRGLMQDSTTYYVKSDDEILRDRDNFVFNQLNTNFGFRFTSAGQPAFPDLAALVMSAGTILANVTKIVKLTITTTSLFTMSAIIMKVKAFASIITSNASISLTATRSRKTNSNLNSSFTMSASVSKRMVGASSVVATFNKSGIIGDAWSIGSAVTVDRMTYLGTNNYYFEYDPIVDSYTTSGQLRRTGGVNVYNYTGGSWVLQTTLKPSQAVIDSLTTTSDDFYDFSFAGTNSSADKIICAVRDQYDGKSQVDVFTRSGTTWTRTQEITAVNNSAGIDIFESISLSKDGNYFAFLDYDSFTIEIYKDTAGSFSLQQSINVSSIINQPFGRIAINSNGTKIIFSNSSADTIYTYTRSGSTWSLAGSFNVVLEKLHTETTNNPNFITSSLSDDFNYTLVNSVITGGSLNGSQVLNVISMTPTSMTNIQRLNYSYSGTLEDIRFTTGSYGDFRLAYTSGGVTQYVSYTKL